MNNNNTIQISVIVAAAIISVAWIIRGGGEGTAGQELAARAPGAGQSASAHVAMMNGGHLMPLAMEEVLAAKLVAEGVIDPAKLPQVTELNLLWAFGLANKNRVLEEGPMMDPRYGGAERFASTGGWTAGTGDPMSHYSRHSFVTLTAEEQALAEKVAKDTFRPCCKNSAYFPDCNHGMAMLGLLEILAADGADEATLYAAALKANQQWFPEAYGSPEKPAGGGGACAV